ncbi:single-stranded DNA-binding protein [Paracandidimonas soli]|uniref:Single-stranded DNA-binding protein n=1 Tax=Paracandidimonas soli TaxID=1917182 RepID=A0A4R3UPX0_9BURK|nr:single-stranded DNA-binding protein [Paracandidimonas soli]TCU92573.1 single-strand DNA-binding protein [Paracandidimonas soli]
MAQLTGLFRIGRDAELRYTQQNDAVASISLAYNYGKKDPNTNNKPTQWVEGVVWGQRAESLAPYLLKGTLLHVTIDDPHIETFQKQDGSQGIKLTGRISNLEFASRPDNGAQPQARAPQQAQQRAQAAQRPAPNPPQGGGGMADYDDEPPF